MEASKLLWVGRSGGLARAGWKLILFLESVTPEGILVLMIASFGELRF